MPLLTYFVIQFHVSIFTVFLIKEGERGRERNEKKNEKKRKTPTAFLDLDFTLHCYHRDTGLGPVRRFTLFLRM